MIKQFKTGSGVISLRINGKYIAVETTGVPNITADEAHDIAMELVDMARKVNNGRVQTDKNAHTNT